jgi:hypothetical protein
MEHVILVHNLVLDDEVASAARAIIRQRELILDLERDGLEAAEARRLLASFEEVLKRHVADRDTCQKLFAR